MNSQLSRRLSKGYFNFPSKHQGAFHWLLQRVTGGLLVFLGLWFVVSLLSWPSFQYDYVLEWMMHPWRATGVMTFIGIVLWHGYLGMEVVIDDYVKNALWHGTCKFLLRASVLGALLAVGWVFFELVL